VRVRKNPVSRRSVLAAALCGALLPQFASALTNGGLGEPQDGVTSAGPYNPEFALVPGFAPAIGNLWLSGLPSPAYRSVTAAAPLGEDFNSLSFDIGSYDAMWDDTWFSEVAAYGGVGRDLERVSNMQSMGGADGTAAPFGRLTLAREFFDGQDRLALGAYGLHLDVHPTAISGFGDDGYTDVAADATWRWTAHPERGVSRWISAHVLILHEGESLMASHAVFGAGRNDELTLIRSDVAYSWGGPLTPKVQYFQITGTSDPVRLGTLDGSPDSAGWIAELDYAPKPNSVLARLDVRFGMQFIAYAKFDGASQDASHNDTVLLHLTIGGDTD